MKKIIQNISIPSQSGSIPLENDPDSHFFPLEIVIPVLLLPILIGWWSSWYAQGISISRYCENPVVTTQLLERVIIEGRPAGGDSRKPYLITAKLLFLVPRHANESVPQYLKRIELFLRTKCH